MPEIDELPPPQELNWGSTLAEFLGSSLWFSDDLIDPAKPPRFIRMYADRWSVRWDESGVSDPAAQSCIDIYFSVRPVSPATMTFKT